MSSQVYTVRFTQRSVFERIAELVKKFNNCAPMIKPIGDIVGTLPEQVHEVQVEGEIRPLRVFLSLQYDGLTITLAEPAHSEESCERILKKFVQEIYKRATDEELAERHIRLNTAGRLIICQECLTSISSFYQCGICGHTYCFEHRFPERHRCKKTKTDNVFKISLKATKRVDAANSKQPSKVIITRIPCG